MRARLPVLRVRGRPRLRRQLRRLCPQLVLPLREPRRRPEQDRAAADRAPADPPPGRPRPELMDRPELRDLLERSPATRPESPPPGGRPALGDRALARPGGHWRQPPRTG